MDMLFYRSVDAKRTHHVADVAEGILVLFGKLLVAEVVGIDLWSYRYYSERPYVDKICVLPAELIN